MIWASLAAFVVLAIAAVFVVAAMWFGDGPSGTDDSGSVPPDTAGRRRRRSVRRSASSGFPNMH